jgi:phenylacetate-CoA ligase
MNIAAMLRRNVTFPLYSAVSREVSLGRVRFLLRSQWWNAQRLRRYQLERMRSLVRHAFDTCPYYRQAYSRAGAAPDDIRTFEDVARLPIVTKSDLQTHREEMVSELYPRERLVRNYSGGSTGAPTLLYQDRRRARLRCADVYRHDAWTGWRIGEHVFRVWGASRDIHAPSRSAARRQFMIGANRVLNAFDMDDAAAEQFLLALRRAPGALLVGYVSGLKHLADMIEADDALACRPGAIISSAESLTPELRRRIQAAFGCEVFDRYGSRETGLMASECERHNMHVNAESVLVEVVDAGQFGPGAGRLIVTDLENYGMPLVRYEIGDVGAWSHRPCPCGRGLDVLSGVQGRVSDFIIASDGRRIYGEFFSQALCFVNGLRSFCLVQQPDRSVEIDIVGSGQELEAHLSPALEKIRSALGGVSVSYRIVPRIAKPPSGKFRSTISLAGAAT